MYLPGAATDVIKIFILGALSFGLAFWIAPSLIGFLYRRKLWRKEVREKSIDGKDLTFFQRFHKEGETKVPRFGGVLVWIAPLILVLFFWLLAQTGVEWFEKINFFSRSQTWLLFFALLVAALLGLTDDILQVTGRGKYIAGGLRLPVRIWVVAIIGIIGGWWFFFKLESFSIFIPGSADFNIISFFGIEEYSGFLYFAVGILYIIFFVLVMLATYSGGVIDGLDGLAGGAFAIIFGAYAIIALVVGQIDTAAFCTTIVGALLAFLWFNIPPARFYMGETGIMALTASLAVVAFLTNALLVLPIIGFLLVIESGSVILQLLSKKFRGRKLFLAAPVHHHFEAKGWPHYKVTMRFWVIGIIMAIIGVTIRLWA